MELEMAQRMLAAGVSKARNVGRTPSIAVVDAAGNLVVFARLDGGRGVNVDIALAKARGAAAFERDATDMVGLFESNPGFLWQMIAVTHGRLMLDIGSVVIRKIDGEMLGAIGVSGASAEEDEAIARAALGASGMSPQK